MTASSRYARNRALRRRGIVLLVMLSLLGIFTAIAMTFVIASGQFRRGAASASRAEQMGDPFDVILQQAMMQIARGSNHPHSVVGPHGLLEDMYGNADAVVGCVVGPEGDDARNEVQDWRNLHNGTGMMLKFCARSFGYDRKPGVAGVDDNGNGLIDEPSESDIDPDQDPRLGNIRVHPYTKGFQLSDLGTMPIADNVDNYYAGRVLTFISGAAAGQSCYILRSKVVNLLPSAPDFGAETVLWITPPNGAPEPQNYDQFVINGRPFNGTGFGSSPIAYDNTGNPLSTNGGRKQADRSLRMLDMPYLKPGDALLHGKVPVALTPNPVDTGYRSYLNNRWPIVDADEDYDAPDEQNMMLANLNGERPIPSLHRPELVRFFHSNVLGLDDSDATRWWAKIPPAVRRRIMLRPDPADHHDTSMQAVPDAWAPGEPFQDADGDGIYTAGIDTFDPAKHDRNGNGSYDAGDPPFSNAAFDAMGEGTWDVDNDGDGVNDSIWVDMGFPIVTSSDGRLMKPLVAVMVIDLDGRANVNAHGSPKHYTVTQEVLDVLDQQYLNSTGSTGGQLRMPNNTPNVPQNTTEERNLIGPLALATFQRLPSGSNRGSNISVSSQIIYSKFPAYATSSRAIWAGAYDGEEFFKWFVPDLVIDDPPPVILPAFGQGYSVADINLGAVLGGPSLGTTGSGTPSRPVHTATRRNVYREILEGQPMGPVTATGQIPSVAGRYGESHLRRDENSYYPGLGIVPRAGRTKMELAGALYPVSGPLYAGIPNSLNVSTTRNDGIFDDNIPGVISYTARVYGSTNSITGTQPSRQFLAWGNSREAYQQESELVNPVTGTFRFFGDFGTPGDHDANGAVGLDLAGQPIFAAMGTRDETIDDPTEINLNQRYNYKMTLAGKQTQGAGDRAELDSPYTPAEMERLLRMRESDSVGALSSRLTDVIPGNSPNPNITTEQWDIPCPHIAPTPELAAALHALGLPVTNPSIGDLLRARFYLAHGGVLSSPPTAPSPLNAMQVSILSTIAMRSYKFDAGPFPAPPSPPDTDAYFQRPAAVPDIRRTRTRLISPDVAIGLRMDINAPFGNGIDDDSPGSPGFGVVDDPGESNGLLANIDTGAGPLLGFDANRDGNIKANAPESARQRFVKDLYCLMMLLIDQNYVVPLAQPIPTASLPAGATPGDALSSGLTLPPAVGKVPPKFSNNSDTYAQHWLTSRRIAQWAVNAADFRDRDSIMTGFEFDADPFFDNDGDAADPNRQFPQIKDARVPDYEVTNGTWDIDDDLIPRTPNPGDPLDYDDTTAPWRGVVWGCEYPDLLLTETFAYHDRRVQNRYDDDGSGSTMTSVTGTFKLTQTPASGGSFTSTNISGTTHQLDPHWDQMRIPQGTACVELYATANPNLVTTLPPELYAITSQSASDLSGNTTYTTTAALHLGKVVGGSPVWRLAITQGRLTTTAYNTDGSPTTNTTGSPRNDIAMRLATNPSTCSLDPADAAFSLMPWTNASVADRNVTIERVVLFCKQGAVTWSNATAGLNMAQTDTSMRPATTTTIDLYTLDDHATNEYALPGDYVVVGPHRDGGIEDVTTIGRTSRTGFTIGDSSGQGQLTPTTNSIRQPIISMAQSGNYSCFIVTSVDGRNDYPRYDASNPIVANFLGSSISPSDSLAGNVNYNQIRPPLVFECYTTAAGAGDNERGFNISEPTNRRRAAVYSNVTLTSVPDTWNSALTFEDFLWLNPPLSPSVTTTVTDRVTDDLPWDGWMTDNSTTIVRNEQLDALYDHTTLRYKSVFLQRLADPTRSWHRYNNPYITMDWMPFDLTVMNGEPWSEHSTHMTHLREPGNSRDRAFSNPALAAEDAQQPVRFASRERGSPRFPVHGQYSYLNLWGQPDWLATNRAHDTRPPLTDQVGKDPDYATEYGTGSYDYNSATASNFRVKWQDPLQHTLGYLNQSYHYRRQLNTYYDSASAMSTAVATEYDYQAGVPVRKPTIRPVARNAGNVDDTFGWIMGCDFNKFGTPESYQYLGMPWRPFNWLTWNNRPFVGAMELMMVPAAGPSRLLYEFDMRRAIVAGSGRPEGAPTEFSSSGNHYYPDVSAAVSSGNWAHGGYAHRTPYGHLLNFFESSPATPAQLDTDTVVGNFYRLFELVTVPSRFSGTRQMHISQILNNDKSDFDGYFEHPSWPFVAPYNYISEYREPGRVNINTMPSFNVWRAITNDFFPDTSRGFPTFARSSQDTGDNYTRLVNGRNLTTTTLQRPSLYTNPFRSYLEGYGAVLSGTTFVNDQPQKADFKGYVPLVGGTSGAQPFLAVDSTLLRRKIINDNTYPVGVTGDETARWSGLAANNRERADEHDPLFALNFPYTSRNGYESYMYYRWGINDRFDAGNAENQQVGGYERFYSRVSDYRNSDRNPFFRYQLYNKLSNTVTTRSNVYAIWVTLGYFEVERVPLQPGAKTIKTQEGFEDNELDDPHRYPDGYRIIREFGSDTGESVRHKAFAMFDRTIPVGFLRGENLNVDKAFLIKRILH